MKKTSLFLTLLIVLVIFISSCSRQPIADNIQSTQITPAPTNVPQIIKQEIFVDYNTKLNQISPKEAWETFKKEYGLPGEMKAGGAGVLWNEERGIAQYIVGVRSKKYSGSAQEIATSFLQEHGNFIQLQNNSLYLEDIYKVGNENRVIYEQRYKNIPVYGTSVQALITPDGRVRQLSVDYYPNIEVIENEPSIDISEFKKAVRDFLIKKGFPEGKELDDFIASKKPEKFIYPFGKGANVKFYSTLLYRLPQARLFLDTNSAEIVNVEETR